VRFSEIASKKSPKVVRTLY